MEQTIIIKECPAKGIVWTKGEDGLWRTDKWPDKTLVDWQIEHDVQLGYAKVIK